MERQYVQGKTESLRYEHNVSPTSRIRLDQICGRTGCFSCRVKCGDVGGRSVAFFVLAASPSSIGGLDVLWWAFPGWIRLVSLGL